MPHESHEHPMNPMNIPWIPWAPHESHEHPMNPMKFMWIHVNNPWIPTNNALRFHPSLISVYSYNSSACHIILHSSYRPKHWSPSMCATADACNVELHSQPDGNTAAAHGCSLSLCLQSFGFTACCFRVSVIINCMSFQWLVLKFITRLWCFMCDAWWLELAETNLTRYVEVSKRPRHFQVAHGC